MIDLSTFDAATNKSAREVNLDAERAFLQCCVLSEPGPIHAGIERLTPEHFYDPLHRATWISISSQPVDEVLERGFLAVVDNLPSGTDMQTVFDFLATGADQMSSMWWKEYLDSIEVAYKTRIARKLFTEGLDSILSDDTDIEQLAQELSNKLNFIHNTDESDVYQTTALLELGNLQFEDEREINRDGIMLGVKSIDDMCGAFQPGELIVLGARTGVGKTALALNYIVHNSIRNNLSSLMFSLEMTASEVGTRLIPLCTGTPFSRYRDGFATFDPKPYERCLISVDDRSAVTVAQMAARAEQIKQRDGLDFMVVDYCQLIKPAQMRNIPRHEQIAQISRDLKVTAKNLSIPVMLLAQLGRAVDKENRDPFLSDFRASGSLEQDANKVIFLHRTDKDDRSQNAFILAKNRSGTTGQRPLAFTGETLTFHE